MISQPAPPVRSIWIVDTKRSIAPLVAALGNAVIDEPCSASQVAVVWRHRVDGKFLDRFPTLRGIVRYGVGYDNVDLDACTSRNIVACNNPAYGIEEVSDTALAMIFAITRGIVRYDAQAARLPASWQENVLTPLARTSRTTIGIIGAGRIGGAVLVKLRALGFSTLMYDPYLAPGTERTYRAQRVATLPELLQQSDIVSIHAPLTSETKGLVDGQFLASMKPGASLVNTARGGIIADLDLLADALKSNRLGSVCLDVLPEEPPARGRLIDAWQKREPWIEGRCLINPHTAFYSLQAVEDMDQGVISMARAIAIGAWPDNALNDQIRSAWLAH